MAKAILFGGFILATQAAMADVSAFPGASDDAGNYLPARVTREDQHTSDRVTSASTAFPGANDDAGVYLPARGTYADRHAADAATTGSAFPGASSGAD